MNTVGNDQIFSMPYRIIGTRIVAIVDYAAVADRVHRTIPMSDRTPYRPDQTPDGQYIWGLICNQCGAHIDDEDETLHTKWHEDITQAIRRAGQ